MGKLHLGLDDLSAFADGELEPGEAREARAHLDACPRCSAELASFTRLDNVLLATVPVDCAGSLELRSALLDGQLTSAEAAIAREHIQSCRTCATDEVAWLASGQALRLMPAALPSARVDAAMRKLTEQPARRSLLPGFGGLGASLGLRVGVAATLVLAIVIGLVPTGPAPEQAQAPNEALVSSVQQAVLYSPTNTFYVLKQEQAAVDALDASTYAFRARISVGGKPTAIALDPVASRILVLDASRKSLIEIDPASNLVVRSSPVDVTGGYTPTSLRVASDGRVVVTAARDPGQGRPGAPRPTPDSTAGEVAVLDTERKLEVVRSVEVAPRQVITDPEGKGALFLSPSATTLVDSSYQAQRKLPGGVGAAYGSAGWIAVLGGSGAEAILHLIGEGAPAPLRLTGTPLAVTSMPDGGFAVLLGSGRAGRIVVVDASGTPVGTTPVDGSGSQLTYDPKAKRFAIVSGGSLVSAALPAGIVARPEQSDTPTPSVAPSVPAVVPPAPLLASPAPSASADPLASPAASAPVAVAPSAPPVVPPSADRISDSLYRISLDGQLPILTTSSATRVWFLDQKNGLNALDIWSGAIYRIAKLPADAQITALAATQSYVFALDPIGGAIHVLSVETERVKTEELAAFRGATALTTDGGSQVWVASGRTPELFSLDVRTGRLEVVDVGIDAQIIAFDATRGLWASDGGKRVVFYDFRSGLATELALRSAGSARSLLPDPSGTLWVGTTAGEVLSVRERSQQTVTRAKRPITSLALDSGGAVWYAAPSATAPDRFVYAPALAGSSERMLPGPATSLTFNPVWRAWLADPAGGFYLVIEAPN